MTFRERVFDTVKMFFSVFCLGMLLWVVFYKADPKVVKPSEVRGEGTKLGLLMFGGTYNRHIELGGKFLAQDIEGYVYVCERSRELEREIGIRPDLKSIERGSEYLVVGIEWLKVYDDGERFWAADTHKRIYLC